MARSDHKRVLHTEDTPAPTVAEVAGWRRAGLWLLALLLRIWGRTLRFEADAATRERLMKSDEPAVVALWHNRLFLSAEIFRRYRSRRPMCGLVSASKDGAWLAAFYRIIGLEPVRGSSSNFGREAARSLIEKMRGGYDIGITPDGPRGPCYTVEPGVLVVARRVNAPMILIGAEFGPAKRLKSWDRFAIAWPFTRIRMRCTIVPAVREDGSKPGAEDLRAALLAINPDPEQ
ncbi:MAG TPA: lysophospholipid acyltransferase family protein [Candidatus Didemnitutus sp.]|nr:lysophospholipid acyltransferase family protein [Candidatus Didemnitutus sp.]